MTRRPKKLSASFVRTVTRPGRYGDGRGGHGLSLLVQPTSSGRLSKTFAQRLYINGKPVHIGIGPYPVVTLAAARRKALENRRAAFEGRDPRGEGVPTVRAAAEKVIRLHRETWRGDRSEKQWRATLDNYVFPRIGDKRVNKVTTADVMAVLLPIWNEKRETARRVRQRIGAIMKWAVAEGYRSDNPAGEAIRAALPKNGVKRTHFKAVAHAEVAAALRRVRDADAFWSTKACFRFVTLTAVRGGEARHARWDEIDLEARVWTVPAERTKTRRDHRVPLSHAAIEVLEEAATFADASGLVFPSSRSRPMSASTLSVFARAAKVGGTMHGMRSSFRDWCSETDVPRDVAEAALSHVVRDKVEAAYRRTDLFERRRDVMENWGIYVTT